MCGKISRIDACSDYVHDKQSRFLAPNMHSNNVIMQGVGIMTKSLLG